MLKVYMTKDCSPISITVLNIPWRVVKQLSAGIKKWHHLSWTENSPYFWDSIQFFWVEFSSEAASSHITVKYQCDCIHSPFRIENMWFNETEKNSRDKRSEIKCQRFQRKSDSLFFQRTALPAVWSFYVLDLTLSASSSGSQPKVKRILKQNGKYMVAGQSTALFSILQRHLQWKTWEELSTFSWAVVGWLLATGAWRFPWRHIFSLKGRVYTTHTPLQTSNKKRQWCFTITFSVFTMKLFSLLKCVIEG